MIYVDEINHCTIVKIPARKYGHRWCHLFSDSTEELLAFAQKIGLSIRWLQKKPNFFHFDIVPTVRQNALDNGAQEIKLKDYLKQKRIQK